MGNKSTTSRARVEDSHDGDVIDMGPGSAMVEVQSQNADTLAISKAEIDLQISTAKNYPRNLVQFQKSTGEMVTYSREAAEKLFYKLPRGKNKDGTNKIIEGPSVRFAEIVGQNWRNCRIGARVLGNDEKHVTSQGVFHDLETNVAISFEIKRRITDKYGRKYNDDMVSVTGSAGAGVAFRNAVLKGVPKMFWQPLYEKALETARGDDRELGPRRKAALEALAKMGVPEAAVLKTLNVTGISKIGGDELMTLRGIYNAIKEGTTSADEAFGMRDEVKRAESTDGEDEELMPQNDRSASVPPSRKKEKPGAKKAPAEKKADEPAKPAEDKTPFLTTAQTNTIFQTGQKAGWKMDDILAHLAKKYGSQNPSKIRSSQLAAIMGEMESGTN